MTIEFSQHALRQIEARNISREAVSSVIQYPDQILQQDQETPIYLKLIDDLEKRYLYRVFVNTAKEPWLIITAYKTSKIEKYGHSLR